MKKYLTLIIWGICFTQSLRVHADLAEDVERSIRWLHPKLEPNNIERYAEAIVGAAKKYSVDPYTLIAIAHQESSFREHLPVGRAGEVGMLQIRKVWLKNPKFRRAFKTAKVADLKNPEKAFYFAGWILNDLKKRRRTKNLPYWTFYNANKFENRFKYYLRVTRHLTAIETRKNQYQQSFLAKNTFADSQEEWTPDLSVHRQLSENKLNQLPESPRSVDNPAQELLRQINWHKKALEVLQQES